MEVIAGKNGIWTREKLKKLHETKMAELRDFLQAKQEADKEHAQKEQTLKLEIIEIQGALKFMPDTALAVEK